jgi:DNA-directed RNA polymerase subunit RPC12/RpoP
MTKEFKCKKCGAILKFDPSSHGLKCDYCESVEVVEVQPVAATEYDLFSAPKVTGWSREMSTVKCNSCGATITSEKLAGSCAFCGSNYVREIPPNPDIIRPETLVSFKIGSEQAVGQFRDWIGKGFFRPSSLKKLKHLDVLKGMYTPFWTYDCKTHSDWWAMSGYYYYVTVGVGKNMRRERRIRWVPSNGSRDGFYDDVMVLASKGLDQKLVDKISPFHLQNLVQYKPEFLSGFLAEEYAVGLIDGWMIAKNRIEAQERDKCAKDVPGDTHSNLNVNTTTMENKYKHILLPVWIAAYQYKGKKFNLLINGQTGEVQGYAPISWLKVAAVVAVCALIGLAAAAAYIMGH